MRPHALQTLVARPTPELERVVAHLRGQLATSESADRALAVIVAGGLEVAAASVCATASALARDGQRVVVVDASDRHIVSRRRLLRDLETEPAEGDTRAQVRVVSLADHAAASPADSQEVVLILARLDPVHGAGPVRDCTSVAVALVTAGRSTMTSLRAIADMLRVVHLELRSVVFVGSSAHDESLGLTADDEASEPPRRRRTSTPPGACTPRAGKPVPSGRSSSSTA
jgi:hypothetical protein